jgi:hypothetical protein
MKDETESPMEIAERRKPIRKCYKGIAMTWRRLFIGTAIVLFFVLIWVWRAI